MKKIELKVKGMHCTSCEMLLKDSLDEIGVKNASASHKAGLVNVEFDEKKLSEEKIKEAIRKEGYTIG